MRRAIRQDAPSRRASAALPVLLAVALALVPSFAMAAETRGVGGSPPSPVDILVRRDLDAPFLDAVPICVPRELDGRVDSIVEKAAAGEWREASRTLERWSDKLEADADALAVLAAIFEARQAANRAARLAAEQNLDALARQPLHSERRTCLRLERARLLLTLARAPEAAAALARTRRGLASERAWDAARLAEIAYLEAEILYLADRRFDAHLAYRKHAAAPHPRLALAARLRLTDLSFDAGKIEEVSVEYETLLPRARAFGASDAGWSLRAAEAALDAGDPVRALRWVERFSEASSDRDARDVAEIRRADLEVRLDDPMAARKRLAALVTRRDDDPIGALAALRAIDLGVSEAKPDERLRQLTEAIGRERDNLRRYAMAVLLRELAARERFDEAAAVATRLAYDGVDPVVMPDFGATLDRLLAAMVRDGQQSCGASVRALGGRYGILIERASSVAPFARLGLCFEQMELPWLAVPVYRSISRRFGAAGASVVALALARSSLATGDLSLPRHMAEAALSEPSLETPAWQAILAETDLREGRTAKGVARARAVLDSPAIGLERPQLALSLARSLAQTRSSADARFLAERLPAWLEDELDDDDSPTLARMRLLEAGLAAAHVLRRAAEHADAFALYRAVDRAAEPGPLRSAARFWLGIARQTDATGKPAWGDDPAGELGSPWGRVADFEQRYESLRDVYAEVVE